MNGYFAYKEKKEWIKTLDDFSNYVGSQLEGMQQAYWSADE